MDFLYPGQIQSTALIINDHSCPVSFQRKLSPCFLELDIGYPACVDEYSVEGQKHAGEKIMVVRRMRNESPYSSAHLER